MQHVVLDSRGLSVRRQSQRFTVRVGDEVREWAADDVRQMVLGPSQMISTDAIALAAETHTDIAVLDWRGNFIGRFAPASLSGAAITKRAQMEAVVGPLGPAIAVSLVLAKCRNQMHLLRALDDAGTAAPRNRIKELIQNGIGVGPSLETTRALLFAVEGQVGKIYVEALKSLLPWGLGFTGRNRRPPRDVVNAALSYGYAIACAQAERALSLAGLEPAVGFLHADRWGKASLTLDFVELFRQPIVDRAVVTLVRRRQLTRAESEEHSEGMVLLSAMGRKLVASQVMQRLSDRLTYKGKKVSWADLMLHEARHLATAVRGCAADYDPYVHRWM